MTKVFKSALTSAAFFTESTMPKVSSKRINLVRSDFKGHSDMLNIRSATQIASELLQDNPEYILAQKEASESLAEVALELLSDNPDYVLAALNDQSISLKDVNKELLENPYIREMGLQKNVFDIRYLPKESLTYKEQKFAIESDGMALQYMFDENSDLHDHYFWAKQAVKRTGQAFQFVHKPPQENPIHVNKYLNIANEAVKQDGLALEFLDKSLTKEIPNVFLAMAFNNPESYLATAYEAVKQNSLALEFVDK